MRKRLFLATAFICILLMAGLTACGEDSADQDSTQNEETTVAEESMDSMSTDQINEKMIGTWVPAEGFEDIYSFGYMTDEGLSADGDGPFVINEDYEKYDGGGATTVEYAFENGKMTYTTVVSEYSAGGSIGKEGIVEVENLQGDTATINGFAYEKLTDDPADPDQLALKAIESRFMPIVTGEWESSDGMVILKLNEDKTMNYQDTSLNVDGTWSSWGAVEVTITYNDPYTSEETTDYFRYEFDEDCLNYEGMNTETLYRK